MDKEEITRKELAVSPEEKTPVGFAATTTALYVKVYDLPTEGRIDDRPVKTITDVDDTKVLSWRPAMLGKVL